MNTSSPLILTRYGSNGLGGGPEMFLPFRSYLPLWHAHQITPSLFLYCTVQSRCVHCAESALKSPLSVLINITGLFPKRTILNESFSISLIFPAETLETSTSLCLGGVRYFIMG